MLYVVPRHVIVKRNGSFAPNCAANGVAVRWFILWIRRWRHGANEECELAVPGSDSAAVALVIMMMMVSVILFPLFLSSTV